MEQPFMRVLEMVQARGVLRSREAAAAGIPRMVLWRMEKQGFLVKVGRGLYRRAGSAPSEHGPLVEAAVRVPEGVICLLSALKFHGLANLDPGGVWIAVDPDARKPRVDAPALRIVRFSERGRKVGVETHGIEGVEVRITSPARTVVDCFRYRNKIGIDVAVAALRTFRERYRHTKNELWTTARTMRILGIIHPYMEAIPWSETPPTSPTPP